jgi:hypothetical protein
MNRKRLYTLIALPPILIWFMIFFISGAASIVEWGAALRGLYLMLTILFWIFSTLFAGHYKWLK